MSGPRVLDLFCGAGGAAMGYHQAGFEVVGVDIQPQPDYPFEFHQGDALEAILSTRGLFDLVHASPPCQGYSALNAVNRRRYPQLIEPTRELFRMAGVPYVIENVNGSPLDNPVTLCGEMFGLGVIRHRKFETSFKVEKPAHLRHRGRVRGWRHGKYFDGPYVAVYGDGGGKGSVEEWQVAMGIQWTADRKSIAEAIPPAFTRWIGEAFRR